MCFDFCFKRKGKKRLSSYFFQPSKSRNGYIYIIEPENFRLKIGRTKRRETHENTYEYLYKRYKTSYGRNMKIYMFEVADQYEAEKKIHAALKEHREKGCELFNIKIFNALETIRFHLNDAKEIII